MSPAVTSAQSAADRRAAEAELRELIALFAPTSASLIGTVRRALRKRMPTAHEIVYEYADNFLISYAPDERGYEGVLALRGSAKGVELHFTQGKALPDPERVLRGAGKQGRLLLVEAASTLRRPAVTRLLDEAINRTSAPFARTGLGPVVVRETTAKKRREASG